MRIRNLVIYSDDQKDLERLRREYRHYCGYFTQLDLGRLTVFTRAVKKADKDDVRGDDLMELSPKTGGNFNTGAKRLHVPPKPQSFERKR